MDEDPIPIMSPIFIDSLIESINKITQDRRASLFEAFIGEMFDGAEIPHYSKLSVLEKLKVYFQNDLIWDQFVKSPSPN